MEGAPAQRRVCDQQEAQERPTKGRRSQQLGQDSSYNDPGDAKGWRDHRVFSHRGHPRR